MSPEELAILRQFVQTAELSDKNNWPLIGDIYFEIERGNEAFVATQFPEILNLSQAMQNLLLESALLRDRLGNLKFWFEKRRRIRKSDAREEQKILVGLVSAIGNLADTFLELVLNK